MSYITKVTVIPEHGPNAEHNTCTLNTYFAKPVYQSIEDATEEVYRLNRVVDTFCWYGSTGYRLNMAEYLDVLNTIFEWRKGNPNYEAKYLKGIPFSTNVPSGAAVRLQKHLDKHWNEIVGDNK